MGGDATKEDMDKASQMVDRDATEGEGQPNPAHGDYRGHEELQREGCHWPGPRLQAAPRYQGEEEARRGSRRHYRRKEKVNHQTVFSILLCYHPFAFNKNVKIYEKQEAPGQLRLP